ncbi:phytanoyl-CoA dioxygenase family protein [Pseudomonas putida]|uniref:Phytanoyl-CoA dioxygenase family protein n=1 Tax=Pseudomonas putida TaxID=303 RepID=A0A7D5ZY25_PSEPU|nr:phytanoyl-CoA dioxygenase family protein [Pseudomonas putida]QLJ12578.1 phytanoyl-CoA dioxygenase family protein [Pseudomonas putida]
MSLIHLPHDASADDVVRCLDAEGYCIIDNAISEELVDAINDQMQPYIGATDDGANNALGKQTRRSGAIIARSPAAHPVIMHPAVVGAAQKYLGRNASKIQLHLTQVISIGPGNKEQFLHRDEGCWEWFDHFPLEFQTQISTIWALDDFIDANGATRLIPGSHKHTKIPTDFDLADTVAAEMKKGSVLIYSGKTIHGGGPNKTDTWRRALNVDYCIGWLRQEENQYLVVPPELAKKLPEDMQRLIGYDFGAAALGYVREFEDPIVSLYPERKGNGKIFMELLEKASAYSENAKGVFDFVSKQ